MRRDKRLVVDPRIWLTESVEEAERQQGHIAGGGRAVRVAVIRRESVVAAAREIGSQVYDWHHAARDQ
jgi:hypothetical protein